MSPETTVPGAVPARITDLFTARYRALTAGLVSTITLVALESLAIITVMPIVAEELGGVELYGWVFSAFFIGSLVGIVVAGGALDRMPLRRPFAAGLSLFAVGLLLGGLAPSMPVLVLARFVQGLGGGAIPPTAYVAIGRSLPENLRPKMFAMLSTAWVVPGIVGPTLAAIVGEATTWRLVFLGLLPFLTIAGIVALSALRDVPDAAPSSAEDATGVARVRRLPNGLLVAAGAGIVVASITSPDLPLILGGSVFGLVLLLPAFRRLTPRGTLVLAAGLPAAILLRGALTAGFFAADAYVPLLLQEWRDTPATLTGLAFTSATLAWSSGSWIQARFVERLGPARFASFGFGVTAAGTLLTLPVLLEGVPPEVSVATWAVAGLGMGFSYSALSLLVLRDAPPAEQGAATSALQLSDVLGTSLGIGVAGAIVAAGERSGQGGIGTALGVAFALSAILLLAGLGGTRRLSRVPVANARSARAAAVD